MPSGPNTKIWARTVLLLGLALTAVTAFRAPAGFSFASDRGAMSFELKGAFVRIAFDIGQECSISDKCSGLAA